MLFNRAYQSNYFECKQSWSEKSTEYGLITMRSNGKRKPGKSKQAQIL